MSDVPSSLAPQALGLAVSFLIGGCYLSHEPAPDATVPPPTPCTPDEPILTLTETGALGDPACPSVDLVGGSGSDCPLGAVTRVRIVRTVEGTTAFRFTVVATTTSAVIAGHLWFEADTCACSGGAQYSDSAVIGDQFGSFGISEAVIELGALGPNVTYHVEACAIAL